MHLAPASPATEVYINNTKSTNAMPVGSYFDTYSNLDPGAMEFKFKKAGSDSVIATVPTSFYDSLRFYTLVLYNNPDGDGTVRAVKINDDYSTMTSDKSSYRFFNMSPDAGDVDLYINNVLVSSDRASADNVDETYFNLFQQHAVGTFNIQAKSSAADTLISEATVNMAQGNAYTIFLKGVVGGTGDRGLKLVAVRAVNF